MTPRFNAKEISRYLAKKNDIPLVFGSATPDIGTFYKANQGKIELLELTKRANDSKLPKVEIVDLKNELANGNRSMISKKLNEKIQENIDKKEQTILFLNRRGFSTFVMCRDCGYVVNCKNCNISMTYHSKENRLKCHYCGYETQNVSICPECKSKNIKYFGTGTEKLENEIHKLFPTAKTIRMDVDTVSKKNSHEMILNKFKDENIDILIGTQMVVKGHHFPNVTLVGVISADSSLNIGDFRANENTFSLLTQVSGRAGREEKEGHVVIQTYNPENFVIEDAKKQDYKIFYDTEIELRKQLKYPPFCDIIMIGITSASETECIKASNYLYKIINKNKSDNMFIFKPVVAPISKIKNKYRWRIIIKTKLSNTVINSLNLSLDEYYKLNFKNTRVIVDTNPSSMI